MLDPAPYVPCRGLSGVRSPDVQWPAGLLLRGFFTPLFLPDCLEL